MERIERNIKIHKLIKSGDTVGVACSGGKDSIALLHYLKKLSEKQNFEVVCINIDHQIRENSIEDSKFVANFCKENEIRNMKFSIDALELSLQRKMTIEEAARVGRYEVFNALIKKGIVDKIALGHHQSDQAETILMHILRGSGLKGATGMDFSSQDGAFIRPMLNVSQKSILKYLEENSLPNVEDETNQDCNYSRNLLRNKVFPLLEKKWPNACESLISFGEICKIDDDYIESQVDFDALVIEKNKLTVKIPRNYFVYATPIINRLIRKAFETIGIYSDIENKHIEMIKSLEHKGENGAKLSLPHRVSVHKEYDYITITQRKPKINYTEWDIKPATTELENGFGELIVKRTIKLEMEEGVLKYDPTKLPKGTVWRYRREGDFIDQFGGGGTKKLKSYLIDKKVPARIRDDLPLLACGNEVFVVAGVDISDKVKLDENSKYAYSVELKIN